MNQKPSLHQMEHYQKFYENGEYVRAVESTTEQNYNMIDEDRKICLAGHRLYFKDAFYSR